LFNTLIATSPKFNYVFVRAQSQLGDAFFRPVKQDFANNLQQFYF